MLKDMDCQRVPVEGNGHGDGGSFLHRLVMRLYGGGGEQGAGCARIVLQEARVAHGAPVWPPPRSKPQLLPRKRRVTV